MRGGGKANLRVLGQNLRVLDKYLCFEQNPWVWDKILGQILGFWKKSKSNYSNLEGIERLQIENLALLNSVKVP